MISAIAARKAAAAAALAASQTSHDVPQPVSDSPSPSSSRTPPPPSPAKKRKQSHSTRPKERVAAQKRQKSFTNPPHITQSLAPLPVVVAAPPLVTRIKRAFSPSRPLSDSSDEEHNAPTPPERSTPDDVRMDDVLSTFRPVLSQNLFALEPSELIGTHSPAGSFLAILQAGEKLSFVGTVLLVVVQGSIALDGVHLRPSLVPHRVFAPCSHPVSSITALNTPVLPCTPIPTRLGKFVRPRDVVLVFSELQTGVEGLSDIIQSFEDVFSPEEDTCAPMPLRGVFLVARASRRIQPFVFPRSWELGLDAIDSSSGGKDDASLSKPLVIIVKGAKRSGKSTLARTVLNRLLAGYRRVAFLECDIGQSEFTPAGMVALNIVDRPQFGPAFTHLSTPFVAHFIGSTSPRANPTHYLACVAACVQTYLLDVQYGLVDQDDAEDDERVADVIPLVINTHGWNKGLGADLTRKVQDLLPVTDIFDFDAEDDQFDQQWRFDVAQARTARIHRVSPIASPLVNLYTAADLRTLSIISYFLSTGTLKEAPTWSTSLPLCAMPPWEVSWKDAIDAVVLGCPGGEDVPPQELPAALNGGIVALLAADPGILDLPERGGDGIPYSQGAAFLSPTLSRCVGLAVIRHAAPGAPHIHVLTPVHPLLLAQCRVLAKGELELPVWAWLDHRDEEGQVAGLSREKVPYLQWGIGEGKGAARRKVRRNLMRWGQT